MRRELIGALTLFGSAVLALAGCTSQPDWRFNKDVAHYQTVATQTEYATVPTPALDEVDTGESPRTLRTAEKAEYWDLTLQEAIHLAMTCSKTLQDLGGTVLRAPDTITTTYDPSLVETDPQFGLEAALSAFDAQLSTSTYFEKNNYETNNQFIGNNGHFQQDYDVFQAQITKRTANGSQLTVRDYVDFDHNNSQGNAFKDKDGTYGSAWDTWVEGELRQPLLRGAGVDFNRIAGPNGRPGVFNGVLLARVRTDVSLAEFESGVRDLIANVENAYWDLYFAYRSLDTTLEAREGVLDNWRRIHALYQADRRGGEAEKEAQAREQYFRFEQDVQDALAGRLVEGTRTNSGSSPGSFRGNPGILVNERRLRLVIGLTLNDRRLIRPADEPAVSPIAFDWATVGSEALCRRSELRRQRWVVKGRELELLATRNFLLPNLDLVGRYRWRGFGTDLIGPDKIPFDSAMANLEAGHFQEWQLGAEFSLPIGFREAHNAVRNAEIRLTRARALLREQEQQVIHDLSDAVAEVDRAYVLLQTNINHSLAAKDQLKLVLEAHEQGKVEFFAVLDAQRRSLDAESSYYQARVEYALAVRNVYYEKGTLLDDCGVFLSEGPWPDKAYRDAGERERRRGAPRPINYSVHAPTIISQGPAPCCPFPETPATPAADGVPAPAGMGGSAPAAPGSLAPVAPGSLVPVAPGSLAPVAPGSLTPIAPGSLAPMAAASLGPVAPEGLPPAVPEVPPPQSIPAIPAATTEDVHY